MYEDVAARIIRDFSDVGLIPGERKLAEKYACARTTIRASLKYLSDNSLISPPSSNSRRRVLKVESVATADCSTAKIAVCFSAKRMKDPQFHDYLSGLYETASENKALLVLVPIDDHSYFNDDASFASYHPSLNVDGYIIAMPFHSSLLRLLDRSMLPCVIFGHDETLDGVKRFTQIYISMEEKFKLVLKSVLRYGHKGMAIVHKKSSSIFPAARKVCASTGVDYESFVKEIHIPENIDMTDCAPRIADWVVEALGGSTMFYIPFGGVRAFEIWSELTRVGIAVPRQLSVIIDSGKFDYFVRMNDITTVYSDASEEGNTCMKAVVRQIRERSLDFTVRNSSISFIERKTLTPPSA